jgi:hypothetical protein
MINETMNLKTVQQWLTKRGLGASADALNRFDEYTVNGNIRCQVLKNFFENISPNGQLFRELECEVITYMTEYPFTFETESELRQAEKTGYIDSYECVRIEVRHPLGGGVDYPVKSREEFIEVLSRVGKNIVKIYPTEHCYDYQDYL